MDSAALIATSISKAAAVAFSNSSLPFTNRNHCSVTVSPLSTLSVHTVSVSAPDPQLKSLVSRAPIPFILPLSLSSSSFRCFTTTAYHDPISGGGEEQDQSDEEEHSYQHGRQEEEEIDGSPSSSSPGCRLYVGNLPYSMTPSQLSQIFQEAGRVESVGLIYDRVTDRSRGFAFVTMGSVEEAKQAIRLFNGSQVGGRSVRVNFPEVPRGGEREVMGPRIRSSYRGFVDSPYKIYAGNLGWSLTSDALKDAFSSQPGLLGAKVVYDKISGRSRGFGFVSFASSEAAQDAIEAMNGVEVEGRLLRLNLATEGSAVSAPQPT
ncbi:33 kDa ribonucleoprotein, chloroplastic [Aristolochia californica]|uniref:33 kDa ribonucleoprotein, chloroplastic n=1 Tax=Aristolochia californica TaxID=171875 RepID=UPI0035DA03B1